MLPRKGIVAAVIAALFLSIQPADGVTITIGIGARVSYLDDRDNLLEGEIAIGDMITGAYCYDSDTPDDNPSGASGLYTHYSPPYGIVLNAGEFVFQTDPDMSSFS